MKLQPTEGSVPTYIKYSGSLTRVFKEHCSKFHINQQEQGLFAPHNYYRESLLMNDLSPLVWARSCLVSRHSATIKTFTTLKQGSLGENLLFTEQQIERSKYQFYLVSQWDTDLVKLLKNELLYARLSYFNWDGQSLSLFELFLPEAHRILNQQKVLTKLYQSV
ncbi:chorismate lyase [Shewanella psychrophila]|uniref:Chorismate lyase n=1 Tax=Shewanella psychrophila TaxID=225848 RepID=A0A1S6HSL7_9GAMM|nr:chorismate lyase [Shewanella psychrophila]AQS38502.1 chorismate lyase [Shewanella psychrophila]